jgi:hypothetical protein
MARQRLLEELRTVWARGRGAGVDEQPSGPLAVSPEAWGGLGRLAVLDEQQDFLLSSIERETASMVLLSPPP